MKNSVMKHLLAGALSAMLVFSVAAMPAFAEGAAAETAAKRTVTVNGSGYATVTPDTAAVVFTVSTSAASAKDAQDENNKKTETVLEALKALDLDEKDIRTSAYNLYPEYTYDDNGNATISSYNASTELTVSGQTVEMAGTVLSAGVSAGVNVISSVQYSCSTYDEAYRAALADAVKNAQAKAEALALASGDTLGKVSTLTEGYEDTSMRADKRYDSSYAAAEASTMNSISLMPGETQITATVTIAYELND